MRVPQRVPVGESESGSSLASLLTSCDLEQGRPPLAFISSSVKWDDSAPDTKVELNVFCKRKI